MSSDALRQHFPECAESKKLLMDVSGNEISRIN